LRADFLQTRRQRFDLFFLLLHARLQFLHLSMLLEKLIEQHRVHLIVPHCVRFSFFVAQHQVWMDIFYLFSNESEAGCTMRFNLRLITEANWVKFVDDFAGLIHRFDVVLKASRRNHGPKLTICIYIDGLRATRLLPNLPGIATVTYVGTINISADTNNVIG